MMNCIPLYILSFLLAFNGILREDKPAQLPPHVIPDLFRNLPMPINKHLWAQGSREILKQVQDDGLGDWGISHSLCEEKACLFKGPLDDLTEFNRQYKDEIKHAVFHYNEVRSDICSQSVRFKTDSIIIGAIVFPELIRYSIYRDFMETTVMEYIYVEYGSAASDFSIGMFQIKPSFVELLENEVQKYGGLKKYSVITNYKSSSDIKEIRKERIERLGSSLWQIIYMNCFYSLLELKFKNVAFADIKDKIRFYATCYNHGFSCSNDEILKWTTRKTFPHGYDSTRKNYCYGDISLLFYYMLKPG